MMPPFIPNYLMPPRTLEESLNYIYSRGIVNNIIGAFFIKECQDKQKNNEKRKVPVSTVDLNNDRKDSDNKQENNDNNDNNDNGGDNNLEKKEKERTEEKNEENEEQEKDNDDEEPKNENGLKMPNMG